MFDVHDSHPLADFLHDNETHVARLKQTGSQEVLTVEGRPELVVQDAVRYQQLMDRLQRLEDVEAIREGLASADRGELRDPEDVYAEIVATNHAVHG